MCFTCFSRNDKRIFYMFFSVAVFYFLFSLLTSFCCSLSLSDYMNTKLCVHYLSFNLYEYT